MQRGVWGLMCTGEHEPVWFQKVYWGQELAEPEGKDSGHQPLWTCIAQVALVARPHDMPLQLRRVAQVWGGGIGRNAGHMQQQQADINLRPCRAQGCLPNLAHMCL